jgi:hypothetical protein
MNPAHDPWTKLAASARMAKDDRDVTAPYGFSTRVAALAFARERAVGSLFERFALRAVGVAALLAIVSTVANYTLLNSSSGDDDVLADDGAESALLDISS